MASSVDVPGGEAAAGVTCSLRGWNNPRPILIQLRSHCLAKLREGVRYNLSALIPRCEALERSLPDHLLRHSGYVSAKIYRDFPLDVGHAQAADRSAVATLSDPPLRIRHAPVAEASVSLAEQLSGTASILAVGRIESPSLKQSLAGRDVVHVTPGDGAAITAPSGARRPAVDSFSGWMASHDEAERAAIGAIVLGRSAGRADVDLLPLRLYGHQWILVEAGSAALTWLLAKWDGSVVRHGDLFAFADPGHLFREPSAREGISSDLDWPRISVVTISYNQCQYLEQCLTSVLNQHYPNLEFIVIDGNSTDGSIDILRRYQERITKLVIEPDDGQSEALNKGFSMATGDILTWVNSDDMLAILALKRAALAFARSGADLVAGTCSRVAGVDARLLYRHHSALPAERRVAFDLSGPLNWCNAWEKGDYFFQPEVFFTRNIWERAGGFIQPHLYWVMDWELWLRFALTDATVIRIPDVLGISREHEAQKTKSDEMYLWQVTNILRDYDRLLARLEGATIPTSPCA